MIWHASHEYRAQSDQENQGKKTIQKGRQQMAGIENTGSHPIKEIQSFKDSAKKARGFARGFLPIVCLAAGLLLSACSSQKNAISPGTERVKETAVPVADTTEGLSSVVRFDPAALKGAWDISGDDLTYVQIDVKDYGVITLALDSTIAPVTVKNFLRLAEQGFYDGLTFHRIMDGFMMQGGDPSGNGTGGSGENIQGEFAQNGVKNPITHVRGAVSMARARDFNSASSQFFIVQSDSSFLDQQYAGFGYVTDGMDLVDQICKDARPTDGNGTIRPEEQPVINSVKVAE